MKIAFVCITHKPISLKTTGGIETLTIYLVNALSLLGHEVTLFAAEETEKSAFQKISFVPTFSIADLEKQDKENLESKSFTLNYAMFQYAGATKAMLQSEKFDIIHYSSAQWYAPFLINSNQKIPIVTTIHVNNLRQRAIEYILSQFPAVHIANISNTSAKPFLKYSKRKTVYNGINIDKFPYIAKPENKFAWLGRVAPVKGLKQALKAAKLADVSMVASGPIDFPEYFEHEVKPLLDEKRTFIPILSTQQKKAEFLGKAKAVLMPVQWEEAFGLVAIEAMSTGTPVIAFNRGGLKETIINGKTGFLVNTVEEMAKKIKQVREIDRSICRAHAITNFSATAMAERYIKYYQSIIAKNIK